jgi:hypothetical protein
LQKLIVRNKNPICLFIKLPVVEAMNKADQPGFSSTHKIKTGEILSGITGLPILLNWMCLSIENYFGKIKSFRWSK